MSKTQMLLLGLAGVTAVAAFIFRGFGYAIPRQTVISILESLNRESYQLMYQISQMAREMINQKKLFPNEVKDIIEQPNNPVSRVFQQLETKAYTKYNVKAEDFIYAVQRVYNKDVEVKYLQRLFSETYQKAMMGVTPAVFIRSPVFMTEEKTLDIFKKVLGEQLRIMKMQLENLDQSLTLKDLKRIIDAELLEFKKKLITQEKLNELADNPSNILEFSVKEYLNRKGFAASYESICKHYENKTRELITKYSRKLVV